MNLDFGNDYQIWDNPEAVTLVSVATAGNTNVPVATALRLPMTTKEIVASGGVYTGQDVIWMLPGALLGATVPKPADRVQDAAATDWTILEVSKGILDRMYKCTARDLVLANGLRDAVDIFRPTNSQDAVGNRVPIYGAVPIYSAIPGKLQDLGGDAEDVHGKRGLRKRYSCWLGQRVVVTTEDQVRVSGVTYQITGYADPDRIDVLMRLDLEKLP